VAAIIPNGNIAWGMQLPVQSQSTVYVQPWEAEAGPSELSAIARAADRSGAFYVAVCDHIAIPRPADESMSTTWYDTVATLGWLGALTEQVHLLSHVYVLPYRHPLITAKSFATLDRLTGGRAILGVGAGHLESEFRLLGADFERRGPLVEEAIGVIRVAFNEEYPTVGGPGAEVGVGVSPRPSRAGGPPIWVGGSSKAAIRRAARFGDGWLPQGPPTMGMRAAIDFIRTERQAAGLSDRFDLGVNCEPIHIGTPPVEVPSWTLTGEPAQVAEGLRKYPERTFNQLQLRFLARSASELCDQIERFGSEVWPQVLS
jgi:probable F420-dependent oxidoreductase